MIKNILILFLLLILFLSINCLAVSSGTFTVNQWGTGNYTTLTSAEAGLQGVLISTCYIIITGSWTASDTAGVTFTGWTTYSTAPIIVQSTGLARHAGVWDNTKYRLSVDAGSRVLQLNEQFVYIDGLQIENTNSNTDNNGVGLSFNQDTAGTVYKISNNIIRYTGVNPPKNTNVCNGLICITTNKRSEYYIWNNIIYGFGKGIRQDFSTVATTFYMYNNTLYNTDYSGELLTISDDSNPNHLNVRMKNNLVEGHVSTGTCYNLTWTDDFLHYTTACNTSSDNTSPNTEYQFQRTSFTNTATLDTYNLMPLSTDTTAYAQGRNLTNDPLLAFNTDIAGNPRPSTGSWTIGAFEVQSTPSPTRKKKVIANFIQ